MVTDEMRQVGEEIVAKINVDFAPVQQYFEKKVQALAASTDTKRKRIFALQQLMSELRSYAQPHVPCKKGCDACCHMRVLVSQSEADAIGYAIRRTPKTLAKLGYQAKTIQEFGTATPCTFLKDGECSIYEHRPFVCRNIVPLAVDNSYCAIENWSAAATGQAKSDELPMLGLPTIIQDLYRQLSGNGGDAVGDIRDFFPPA